MSFRGEEWALQPNLELVVANSCFFDVPCSQENQIVSEAMDLCGMEVVEQP